MSVNLIADLAPLAADGGILDWLNAKNTSTQQLFRGLSYTVGIGFVILVAIKARGAMAAIITSGIAAAIFIWIVNNVTDVSDRVDSEINGHGVPTVVEVVDPPALSA